MTTTIRSRKLTKTYGEHTVVDRLDLDIEAGEVFGLLGPNGAGKTTTILMLLGLVEPTKGKIEVLGLDPRWNPLEVKRKVGYLPDAVGFYDTMTGRENLRFTARLNGIEDSDEHIDSLLDLVGLRDAGDQPAGEYSRGMKQRLGVADALVKGPSVLILDEPTTAIDPEGVDKNFAIHFPWIDRIFGTYYFPEDGKWPDTYGLANEYIPRGFWAQAVYPFMRRQAA